MIRSEIIGTYSAANAEYFGLGYIASYLSGFSAPVAVTVEMICAGITLFPVILASITMEPVMDATITLEEC